MAESARPAYRVPRSWIFRTFMDDARAAEDFPLPPEVIEPDDPPEFPPEDEVPAVPDEDELVREPSEPLELPDEVSVP